MTGLYLRAVRAAMFIGLAPMNRDSGRQSGKRSAKGGRGDIRRVLARSRGHAGEDAAERLDSGRQMPALKVVLKRGRFRGRRHRRLYGGVETAGMAFGLVGPRGGRSRWQRPGLACATGSGIRPGSGCRVRAAARPRGAPARWDAGTGCGSCRSCRRRAAHQARPGPMGRSPPSPRATGRGEGPVARGAWSGVRRGA